MCILMREVRNLPKREWNEKVDGHRGIDETDPVVSACECTGMLPAKSEEGEDTAVCHMMNVHPQPHRRKKEKKL